MKNLHQLVIAGVLIPFLSLSAENAESEAFSAAQYSPKQEQAPFTSLQEELSLLDEEFEELKEELFSLESDLQQKEPSLLETMRKETQAPENLVIIDAPKEMETQVSHSSLDQKSLPAAKEEMTMELVPVSMPVVNSSSEETLSQEFPATLNIQESGKSLTYKEAVSIDLSQAFAGSPIIYSILLCMSAVAVTIWLYSLLALNRSIGLSYSVVKKVQNKLHSNQFEEVLSLCSEKNNVFCKMVASGIQSRRHGLPVMIESMKAEGKRVSTAFWQKLSLLNDIAIIAPMIGLLGTVLGMFYAFYDINRSIESISTLFDGLGVSVGTTVAGLIVAILALILHSTAKYRLIRSLAQVENEAQSIATLIDDRTSINKG